jgi:tetratricopeptide (TPR) repeat protein
VDFNPILRQVGRFEVRELWQLAADLEREIGREFIAAMDTNLPALLDVYPGIQDDGEFWRYRGWFKYYIGLAVFHAGDETFAREALDSAQPDADRAGELGAGGSFAIQTYLPEAAWGWYHIERGDVLYDEGDFESALAYYEKAAAAIMPDENTTAYEEATLAAFRTARTAVALTDFDLALFYYEEGLVRAAETSDEQGLIASALAALNELLDEMPELAEDAEPVQELLEEAAAP